ncbi:MAG TPA: hemerythrin domain-containing protein [Burkholderiales bacterium]|nr:hemerythrin domain-containing protein [Burkholderiales bacterium]
MTTIANYLTQDHRSCDRLLEVIESAARTGRWDAADQAVQGFDAALSLHLDKEEQLLFPAIEAKAGSSFGPTQVMRQEHESMRELVRCLRDVIAQRDREETAGTIDTLGILIGQHNMKEEGVLYPVAARLLDDVEQLVQAFDDHRADVSPVFHD